MVNAIDMIFIASLLLANCWSQQGHMMPAWLFAWSSSVNDESKTSRSLHCISTAGAVVKQSLP